MKQRPVIIRSFWLGRFSLKKTVREELEVLMHGLYGLTRADLDTVRSVHVPE
jgi:hypothetical protein